jgi:predicted heme/steroid binding protein
MGIYFDFKTIDELTSNNYSYDRVENEFTVEELDKYNGENGKPAYVAIGGVVYDVSKIPAWKTGKHFGLTAGQDLSEQFESCHGIIDILANSPKVGVIMDDQYMNYTNNMNNNSNAAMNRIIRQQDTSKFTPDDWIRYTVPLVVYALREPNEGMNIQRIYQKIILMGVLVGLGRTPQQAINQVQEWQNTGVAKLLQGGATTGTTTGGTGGTSGGFGTGTTTGGTGGTSGGFGTGTTVGGTGGTSGGLGTGTTVGGTGGTSGGLGTGTTTGGTGGTSGGFGTGTTGGGIGGTSGGSGTGVNTGTVGTSDGRGSDRLYID